MFKKFYELLGSGRFEPKAVTGNIVDRHGQVIGTATISAEALSEERPVVRRRDTIHPAFLSDIDNVS